jgi:hypothetical protein
VLRKLSRTRTDGSSLLGAGAVVAAFWPFFWQKVTVLSAATQNVVEVALYAGLSNVLFFSQSSGSTELDKVRLRSRATTQGRGGTRYIEKF